MSNNFSNLWNKYHDTFGTWFPTMCFPTDTQDEVEKRLKECLDKDLPAEEVYELDYDSDIVY